MSEADIQNSTDLTGKTALVTGASSGLGVRFAKVLAAAGARVVLAARRADKLAELAQVIGDNGGTAHAVSLDVNDFEAIPDFFAKLRDEGFMPDIQIGRAHV